MSVNERIDSLRQKHENLDKALHREETRPSPDSSVVTKLKREKLALKDNIQKLAEPDTA